MIPPSTARNRCHCCMLSHNSHYSCHICQPAACWSQPACGALAAALQELWVVEWGFRARLVACLRVRVCSVSCWQRQQVRHLLLCILRAAALMIAVSTAQSAGGAGLETVSNTHALLPPNNCTSTSMKILIYSHAQKLLGAAYIHARRSELDTSVAPAVC